MNNLKLTIFLVFGFYFVSFGKSIDLATAKKVAGNFLNVPETQLIYQTENAFLPYSPNLTKASETNPLIYIFNTNPQKGFVIIAGDDNATPVLAYSNEGQFDINTMPRNVKKWLEGYKNELNYILSNDIKATSDIKNKWETLKTTANTFYHKASSVSPLLATTWGQTPYYNALCPGGSVTGCVATAMAQIMNYWEYPTQGVGFHSYNEDDYGTVSANFGGTTYDWASMPNNVTSYNNAVATLMFHCGVSVDMNYSPQVSGAYVVSSLSPITHCSEYAFTTYFNYANTVQGVDRANYSTASWIQLLKNELDAGRPIEYAGFGSGGGHAFVCDGYDNNDFFHFNWGWSGSYDGYFMIDALNPSGTGTGGGTGGYNSNHQAVIGIQPPTGGSQSFDLILYDNITPSNTTLYYGQSFTVSTNIANNGGSAFNGDYTVAIFDNSSNFIDYVEILSGYNLPAGNVYNNNLVFSTNGILGMLPGTYYAGVFYRPSGGNWQQVDAGNFAAYTQINVINPNDMELNSAMVVSPSNTLTQGEPASVNLNIINNGASTFFGEYSVDLYNLDGSFAQTISSLTENNGLPSGYTYQSPYLSFNTNAITVEPGTYLLALQHNYNNTGWQLTGSSNFQNPLYVTVAAPSIVGDNYEYNDTEASAYEFPINFTSNSASVLTTGSNNHTGSDYDFYTINLPIGYDYSISARVHDSYNSANGMIYTNDVLWSYKTDGSWSNAFDDIMPSTITVQNGGRVDFQVAPYFQGESGTYLLDIQVSKTGNATAINDINSNSNLILYPNPTSDYLNVSLDKNEDIDKLTIVDILGQTVKVYKSKDNLNIGKIPVDDLSNGTYFLIVEINNNKWVQKFTKNED